MRGGMNNDARRKILEDAIRSQGVSVAEFCIMHTLVDDPRVRGDLVAETELLWKGDILERSVRAYHEAVKHCLQKGWIKLSIASPSDSLDAAEDGMFDLTLEGYRMMRRAQAKGWGIDRSAVRFISSQLTTEIYGDSESICTENAKWYIQRPHFTFPSEGDSPSIPAVFHKQEGPLRIGEWRYNRFEMVQDGYLLILHFKRK